MRMILQLTSIAVLCTALLGASFATTVVIARPTATLNGWGPNAHVGAYELGVNQGYNWGFNNETTYPYTNTSNGSDGNPTTFAYSAQQHTHKYSGCIFTFSALPPSGEVRTLNIDSAVPPNGTDGFVVNDRSAGVWYSTNSGATWTQVYNTPRRTSRPRQIDSIPLGASLNLSQLQVMVFSDAHDDMYHKVFDISVTEAASVTGYINPKYVVLGVTYAPPGPNSNVTYTNSNLVGNTTETTQSFQNTVNVTVSVSKKISAWSVIGGAGVEVTGTQSTEYTQGTSSSTKITVSKEATVAYRTSGTGDAFFPVNHDYDTIWLWLNPLLIYSVYPDNPTHVQWNGYGYDSHDVNGMDVFGVQVGWLNGHFGVNPSIQAVLARSWVTRNEPDMIWPAGDGPGLNATDISNILQADPLTGPYILPAPFPATTADGRFTQIPYPPNPVNYIQAGPGNGGGTTTMYNTVNINSSSVAQGTSQTFKQSFGVEAKFSGGTWFAHFTLDVKETNTTTSTQTWQSTLTNTTTLTNALAVTGPGCPQTSPPCVPSYTGPGEFIVFQDNLYGTFMFYPLQ